MKKKINKQYTLITVVAIVLTVFLSVIVYYDMFQGEVINSLKTYTNVLRNSGMFEDELLITVVAIVLTVFLSVIVYYDMFQGEVINSLKTYTNVLRNSGMFEDELLHRDEKNSLAEDLRVTLVEPDGSVSFDSNVGIGDLDNHGERPEIQEALNTGEGEQIRHSDTLQKNVYYYAVRMEDGSVLRVAKEAGSIWSFLMPLMPVLFVMIIVLAGVCVILAHFMTQSIVKPVEEMAQHMDDSTYKATYKELQPFIDTIQQQHQDIVKSSRIRQEFTANVSHELKTPLTAISGYSELIESGIATKEIYRECFS